MASPVRIGMYKVKITLITANAMDKPKNNQYFFIYLRILPRVSFCLDSFFISVSSFRPLKLRIIDFLIYAAIL